MQIYRSLDPLLDLERPLELETELEHEPALRALIVADDPLVRSSFVERLGGAAAGDAHRGDDLAEAIGASGANLVVWDVGPVPDASYSPSMAEIPVPVVALCPEGSDARRLLAEGATAVLVRENASRRILRNTLRSVLCGLTVVDPRLVESTLVDTGAATPSEVLAPIESLTAREQEVLELMATGLSNKQIGGRLGISSHTAKFHIGAILAKLDAQTRTEAVVRAVQRGLVTV